MSWTLTLRLGFLAGLVLATPPVLADGPKVELVLGRWLPGERENVAEKEARAADPGPLRSPFGVDFQSDGTMVIVELEGGRVHRLAPSGQFETISGDGSKGYLGDGGPAQAATFNGMHNVAVTPNDAIYISDSWNHVIRRIDPQEGTIATVAGTGEVGNGGDDGPATSATFNYVMCIALNAANDAIYIADLNNRRIRKLDLRTGIVSNVAGNGEKGVPADGTKATEAPLVDPRAVAVDSQERVYILERGGHALRVVEPDGKIRTVAGNGRPGWADGKGDQVQFHSPKHLCVDGADRVYIADDENGAIRRFDPKTGEVATVLGRGVGSPAPRLSHPHGVCVEGDDLYVVDTGNDRIFRLPGDKLD